MRLQKSKYEILYQQARNGNFEGIKLLRGAGGLEWMDKERKTPLIFASMNPKLYGVAKALIELGANVNAYRPGRNGGTPLHHAAGRGLEQMVKLLLSHGANALVMNDECQTALDVARDKGHSNVVRAIENHICLFSGWLHQLYEPRLHHLCAPHLFREKVWVVIVPREARTPTEPFKLELAIYSDLHTAKPRSVTPLCTAKVEELNSNHPKPSVLISSFTERIKFAAINETRKQQFQRFCKACKGIRQVMDPARQTAQPSVPSASPTAPPLVPSAPPTSPSVSSTPPITPPYNLSAPSPVPSAPPISDMLDDGPLLYSPIDSTTPIEKEKDGYEFSTCVICLDAPIEGACIPCGHMAGCISCLTEHKDNNWGCPVCCNKIYQVVQLCVV